MNTKNRLDTLSAQFRESENRRMLLAWRVEKLEAMLANPPWTTPLNSTDAVPLKPKPIDWSQVADCVPVKVWDDSEEEIPVVLYPQGTQGLNTLSCWAHASLITDIDVAWSGGGCPLPEGVKYVATLRDGRRLNAAVRWHYREKFPEGDVISFRVTGIHPDWTEEVGE